MRRTISEGVSAHRRGGQLVALDRDGDFDAGGARGFPDLLQSGTIARGTALCKRLSAQKMRWGVRRPSRAPSRLQRQWREPTIVGRQIPDLRKCRTRLWRCPVQQEADIAEAPPRSLDGHNPQPLRSPLRPPRTLLPESRTATMTPLSVRRLDRRNSSDIEAHPARTLGLKARKRERVRCSSLVDWPVYPRLRRTMLTTTPKRNPASKSNRSDAVARPSEEMPAKPPRRP